MHVCICLGEAQLPPRVSKEVASIKSLRSLLLCGMEIVEVLGAFEFVWVSILISLSQACARVSV